MNKLLIRSFSVIFIGLLILTGFAVHELEQSMNELDIALDHLEQALGIEDNGDDNE